MDSTDPQVGFEVNESGVSTNTNMGSGVFYRSDVPAWRLAGSESYGEPAGYNGRYDCLFEPDNSTVQRKQLYNLLEGVGYSRQFLRKQYTY